MGTGMVKTFAFAPLPRQRYLNPDIAKKFDHTDTGKPLGKASGEPFVQ